jgi:putative oxidoreductase
VNGISDIWKILFIFIHFVSFYLGKGTHSMAISLNLGLLILRVVVGLTLAAHGAQKAFGWFEGPGFGKLHQGFKAQGYKPSALWTVLVILGELGGGLSLAFGFLTALGAAGVFAGMLMALIKAHWKNGFWNGKNGIEFTLVLSTVGFIIGLTGPGTFALDTLLGGGLANPILFIILAVIGIIVDVIGVFITRPAPAAATNTPSPAAE